MVQQINKEAGETGDSPVHHTQSESYKVTIDTIIQEIADSGTISSAALNQEFGSQGITRSEKAKVVSDLLNHERVLESSELFTRIFIAVLNFELDNKNTKHFESGFDFSSDPNEVVDADYVDVDIFHSIPISLSGPEAVAFESVIPNLLAEDIQGAVDKFCKSSIDEYRVLVPSLGLGYYPATRGLYKMASMMLKYVAYYHPDPDSGVSREILKKIDASVSAAMLGFAAKDLKGALMSYKKF